MFITQAVQDSALHDLQRFKVESFVDWCFTDDDVVVLKVRWGGFSDDEDTWESVDEDVSVVDKYVKEIDNPDLTQALARSPSISHRNH